MGCLSGTFQTRLQCLFAAKHRRFEGFVFFDWTGCFGAARRAHRIAANAARRRALRITERDALGRVLPGSINVNGGRPKGATVTTLARTYTDRAIQLLGAVMEDERSPQAALIQRVLQLWQRSGLPDGFAVSRRIPRIE